MVERLRKKLLPLFWKFQDVLNHLRGIRSVNFKRLFHATSFGDGCRELDRAGIKMPKFLWELSDREDGYFLPGWTWAEVRAALYKSHLARVARKEESALESACKPAKEDRL